MVQCHGSFATATCTKCKRKVKAEDIREDIFAQRIPHCTDCEERIEDYKRIQTMETPPPPLPEASSNSESQKSDSQSAKTDSEMGTEKKNNSSSNNEAASTSTSEVATAAKEEEAESDPMLQPGIMKPDIVFFGEGLGDEFHDSVAKDKERADLLIMIGSSLKVRPVALIPSSVPSDVPQILINRERLPHLTPDVELLGDCDGIVDQICRMLGEGWEEPLHRQEELTETRELLEKEEDKQWREWEEKAKKEAAAASGGTSTDKPAPAVVNGTPEESVSAPEGSTSAPKRSTDAPKGSTDAPKGSTAAPTVSKTLPETSSSAKQDNGGGGGEPVKSETPFWLQRAQRQSLANRLPESKYFFQPPNRYVFPGAEVYSDDEDDSDSNSSNSSDDESNSNDREEQQQQNQEVPQQKQELPQQKQELPQQKQELPQQMQELPPQKQELPPQKQEPQEQHQEPEVLRKQRKPQLGCEVQS